VSIRIGSDPVGYSVVNVDEIEGAGPGGGVRFVRRVLGVEAFGINWFELPPGSEGREHDEKGSGQEEVSVVVRGSGVWRVDGEDVPVREGSFVRFDPETTRCPVAGPDGMTFVSVGSPPGGYEPRGPF
jgi:quercetin dioxygenase-like cupin family protein